LRTVAGTTSEKICSECVRSEVYRNFAGWQKL
jgi:hypothetical protein